MSEASKHGSGLPIRKTRKISVMAPTVQIQTGCSTNMENNPFPRGQTGLPRNRLGNRFKKPILSEYRQNQIAPKPLDPTQRVADSVISKSTPDLSRNKTRPKLVKITDNLQKMKSLENLAKGRKFPAEKVQPPSRIPAKSTAAAKFKPVNELIKKPKRMETTKKSVTDVKRVPKQVENRRKTCLENADHPKQKITSKELLSPTAFPCSSSPPKNRMEECRKIVKKIMLDKKLLEVCERGRGSGEFEDSIETWNSDEITELLMDATRTSSELDTSKRNSNEFDDSIGSFFSDQMVLKLSRSNEFLSAGSKQSFFNDNQLKLSMSEDLDNLTPGLSDLSNQMDRTPSAEDLPMECEPDTNSTIQATSARSTSPELPQESMSSRAINAPVSIITSITSIMSLDTGYQGDGELSRPESRNTENESRLKLPVAENGIPVRAINFDDGKTMTDSDFFTESDADVHDDLSAAAAEIGSGKGDRKAQVIDGTLYGGAFIQTHAPRHGIDRAMQPTTSTNEDMESSGIYSDLEKKPEDGIKEPVSYLGMITEQMKTIQNLAMSVAEGRFRQDAPSEVTKSSSAESNTTVQEVTSSVKTSPKSGKQTDKKTKVASRNATPKTKCDTSTPEVVRTKTVKKGKWDAVMDKIAQGKEENKYSPSKFRDIKSKVFQNIGPLFNGRKSEPEVKTPTSTQLKARSRRSTRIRSSESSLVSPKSKLSRTSASPNSSQRSSLSDISLSGNPHPKSGNRASKKRESVSPPSNESTNSANTPTRKLNNNDVSIAAGNRTTPCRNSDLQNGNVLRTPSATGLATMKTPAIRKTPTPRRNESIGQGLHRTASVPLKDSNHNGVVSKSGSAVIINNNNAATQNNNKVKSVQSFQSKSLKVGATRGTNTVQVKNGCLLAVAKETNKALLKQLKHNSRAFESLAILFAYCTNDLDAFATPQLKQKLETERSKFNQAQSDLEELQSRLIRVREELNDKELVIGELKNEKASLGENFQKLVEELKEELKIVTEHKREAESKLLKECESVRHLRRELSDRTDRYETEKDSFVTRLSEIKKENGVLKIANRELKEEYDKCLVENQRLVEVLSKRQTEVARVGKENVAVEERRWGEKEKSPNSMAASPVHERSSINPSSLESEVESLRQVLALKTDEVTELRRQELFLRENADRVPKLLSTITMLEGKVEDLQTQLSSQTETVRDLFKSNEHLEEELKTANIQKTRLSHKNEELQYKLKQYTEAMKQLANQKNLSERNMRTELSPLKSNSKKQDGNMDDSMKSHMKAVVEKSDSVSYMLEMTEDTSEIVTNIIRRAESLRSTSRDTLPKKKRSKACSVSSADADRFKRNSLTEEDFHPGIMSTPNSSPCGSEFMREANGSGSLAVSPMKFNKSVKLNQDDFSTDSIELAHGNDCEVIEITKSFDKMEKNAEMVTSTSSSASSNGSHFDIESDVFSNLDNDQNIHDLDEDTESSEFQENGTIIRTFRRETENIKPVLPVYTDIDPIDGGHSIGDVDKNVQNPFAKTFVKIPKISGGEAMIGLSSDEEDIDKIRMNM